MPTLFEQEEPVKLYLKDDAVSTPILRFPMGKYSGELPHLVLVRSSETGRALIAGTALWGNSNMGVEADAVRVAPSVIRALERPKEPSSGRYHPAVVKRARLGDIAIYQRGLGLPLGVAAVVCLAAVAGAIATFITSKAPFGFALTVLVLVCLAAVATAGKSVRDKVSAP
jgi:hypothetical protein